MWPFTSNRSLDRRVQQAWGEHPWIGLWGNFGNVKRPAGPRKLVRKLARLARQLPVPVMISLQKPDPVAEDRSTGRTAWWAASVRIACPVHSQAIDFLREAFQDATWDIDGLGMPNVSQNDFATAKEALDWCPLGPTWRVNFGAVPPPLPKSDLPKNNVRGLAVVLETIAPTDDTQIALMVGMAYHATKLHAEIPQLMLKLETEIRVHFENSCEAAVERLTSTVREANPGASCWVLAGRFTGKQHPVPFECRLVFTIDDGRGEVVRVTTGLEWVKDGLKILAAK